MITRQETFVGLYAAWRLFIRDPRGADLLDDSVFGVVKSFFCAVVVLPGYIVLRASAPVDPPVDIGFGRIFLVDAIAYAISWTAWPLLMAYIAPALDRDDRYCRYVAAINWAGGPNMVLLLLLFFAGVSGLVPKDAHNLLSVAVFVVFFVYHLFIVRVVLDLTFFVAFGLVAAEVVLQIMIIYMREAMLT